MITADYFSSWLERQKTDIARSTYESESVYLYKHIIPWFSERFPNIEDITAFGVREYIDYKKTGGRKDNKAGGLGRESLKKHLSIIKQILDCAAVDGYIPSNPALPIKLKRSRRGVASKYVLLTPDEGKQLVNAFKGHRLYVFVMISLYYGLRKSEALGLRWSAFDFEHGTFSIEHTVVKSLTIEAKDTTKTDSSRATYELLPEVKTALLDLKEQNPPNTDYVFVWQYGKRIGELFRPDDVTRAFQRVLKNAGLPKMRLHDLRHSCASILFDKNVSLEDVSKWLRHSDIETTSNIYLHYQESRKVLVMDKLQGLFIS